MNNVSKVKSNIQTVAVLTACALILSGCASMIPGADVGKEKFKVSPSYLEEGTSDADTAVKSQIAETLSESEKESLNVKSLKPVDHKKVKLSSSDLSKVFSSKDKLTVSVNAMSLRSFLHYVYGDLLNIDYVIGNKIPNSDITLNITNQLSSRKLFEVSSQVLQERGIGVRLKDNIYYIYQIPKDGKSNVTMAFGGDYKDVPESVGQILQIVPLRYGLKMSIERTLKQLTDVRLTVDVDQGTLFIQGRKDQIVRALDLIKLLDVPSNHGKYIALISPVYISIEEFVNTVTTLLKTEGLEIGKGGTNSGAIRFVELGTLGAVAVFSSDKTLLNRVEYWAEQIDKPTKGTEKQYHFYTPVYARASDLAESIAPLISGTSSPIQSGSNNASSKDNKNSSQINRNTKDNSVVKNDKMSLVVDKRSNTLIFNSSGTEYQAILPLVKRLDVVPKQILLSVTIAEVKLTGVFKRGFEFALSSGNFGATTKGAFGLNEIAGAALNWSSGLNEVVASFVEENSQINVLSKPTLLVRDGTDANINIGDRIPVSAGSTTGSSGDIVTENISYQETGIRLKVSPTVNARGVIIMKITQDISNQVDGQLGKAGNPVFFERNLMTEVVVDSGQTILLGGLISENTNNNDKGIPFLKSIPLIGSVFESESKTNIKNELVIMVTAKIVDRSSQWQSILNKFEIELENIDMKN
jgi:general secretion pathway protein D